jgi:hypothetical protein
MSERLRDAWLKIERARTHLSSLDSEVTQFGNGTPYPVVTDRDEAGNTVAKVLVAEQPPPRMAAIVGDIVHNLRSALDYVAWQLVDANRGNPGKHTSYPICSTPEKFELSGRAALYRATESAILAVRTSQPFTVDPPDTHPLAILEELDNHDKHRLLHVIAGVVDAFLVKPPPEMAILVQRPPRRPLVNGDVIATIKSSTRGNLPIRVTVGLVLLNREDAPLRPLLDSQFAAVEDVLARAAPCLA